MKYYIYGRKKPSLEELASQTEINPRELKVPHRPHHFVTKKVFLLLLGLLLVVIASLIGTYYVKQMEQSKQDRRVPPTVPTATPTLIEKN